MPHENQRPHQHNPQRLRHRPPHHTRTQQIKPLQVLPVPPLTVKPFHVKPPSLNSRTILSSVDEVNGNQEFFWGREGAETPDPRRRAQSPAPNARKPPGKKARKRAFMSRSDISPAKAADIMRLELGFLARIALAVAQLSDLRVLLRIIASMLNHSVYAARQHGIATSGRLSLPVRLAKRGFDGCKAC
jgi:hypothetical protein